jgi:hypothetical protein
MAATTYPLPQGDDAEALHDAAFDMFNNGAATLHPDEDPEKWIFWLKRWYGFYEVRVRSHTEIALILEGI